MELWQFLCKVFENNLFNWLVLAALLFYGWNKVMPGLFAARREQINNQLAEAGRAKKEGENFLETQKQRIANAEREAEQILVDAKRVASEMKVQIAEQTKKDIADLQVKLEQQIETQRQMVITELRSQAATAAVRLAEAALPGAITPGVTAGLQDRFVQQLETLGAK